MNTTIKEACALIKLSRRLTEKEWVIADDGIQKELGSINELLPKVRNGGVLYFNYPNMRMAYVRVFNDVFSYLIDFNRRAS